MHLKIRKGLDIKMAGSAADKVLRLTSDCYYVRPSDFRWFVPKLLVAAGDEVEVGTPLFCSKADERVVIVSPIRGVVKEIVRGERRVVEAVVLTPVSEETACRRGTIENPQDRESLVKVLMENGLWPFLRQRPYSIIANPDFLPKSLFISCFDSAPLAPDFSILLRGRFDDFREGVRRLKQLVGRDCPINLCLPAGKDNAYFEAVENVNCHTFQGPHPAGNVGTQIHQIDPIDKGDVVWYIHPQDVAAIGRFFLTGELSFEKMIAFTGPCAQEPCYYSMVYGADASSLMQKTTQEKVRVISGNVLTGVKMETFPTVRFYDAQVTVIAEGGEREFIGWLLPGFNKWSISHTFLAWIFRNKKFPHTTSLQGGRRNFVMSDVYDKVFPFAILPMHLLKACLVGDIEQMEELGIYEVDDEDFALCEVVCPSKTECQKIIREGLYQLKKDTEK